MKYHDWIKCKNCNKIYNTDSPYEAPKYCNKCATQLTTYAKEVEIIGHRARTYMKPKLTENSIKIIGYKKWFKLYEFKRET